MNIAWRSRWHVTPDITVLVRVLAVAADAFVATLHYPSLTLAGEALPALTIYSTPRDWAGIRGYFEAFGMTSGWAPSPPPLLPPTHPLRTSAATTPPPSRRARRLSPRLAAARRLRRACAVVESGLGLA